MFGVRRDLAVHIFDVQANLQDAEERQLRDAPLRSLPTSSASTTRSLSLMFGVRRDLAVHIFDVQANLQDAEERQLRDAPLRSLPTSSASTTRSLSSMRSEEHT